MAIEPVTREERFLAAAGGQSVTPPTPITRKEQLLQGIIDAVQSGGGNGSEENPDQDGADSSGVGAWRYLGKFTTEEHINTFMITQDAEGNPFEFTSLFLRVNLRWFQLSTNPSANRGIDLLGDDGRWYELNLNGVTALKLSTADTIDGIVLNITDISPIQTEKIGDYLYFYRALEDQFNSSLSTDLSMRGNKGISVIGVNKFKGFRFTMGYATNLIVAGSNVEVWYK